MFHLNILLKLYYQFIKTSFWNMMIIVFISPILYIIVLYVLNNDSFNRFSDCEDQKNFVIIGYREFVAEFVSFY